MTLPLELLKAKDSILGHALGYGLDPFTTVFEMVSADELNAIASYEGFPTRYPHWRFGMEFERLDKTYAYGLQKIYELVINNDPCYAYLMNSNSMIDQKLVIAHVFAHSDFFKNNAWFGRTNRKMIDEMANHGGRIRKYSDKHGVEEVENFVDACLSIENLIDAHSMYAAEKTCAMPPSKNDEPADDDPRPIAGNGKEYMERFMRRPEIQKPPSGPEDIFTRPPKFPRTPEKDILKFLVEHAPIPNWQKDILAMIREEAYYFAPQGMTKIMNEGWAAFWHSRIMTQKALDTSEIVDFADHHSGTVAMSPGRLNPYKIGLEIFRNIEERWNKGRFGKEYASCDDHSMKSRWDTRAGLGTEKIFEVRRIYNDITFIDEFLTKELCLEQKLFVYKRDGQSNQYVISDRDFNMVRKTLLTSLTNMGNPVIEVEDGNHDNKGELLLRHRHGGLELDMKEGEDALRNIHRIWKRPVSILTFLAGSDKMIRYDGKELAVTSPA